MNKSMDIVERLLNAIQAVGEHKKDNFCPITVNDAKDASLEIERLRSVVSDLKEQLAYLANKA